MAFRLQKPFLQAVQHNPLQSPATLQPEDSPRSLASGVLGTTNLDTNLAFLRATSVLLPAPGGQAVIVAFCPLFLAPVPF